MATESTTSVRVLGVDDWAKRKGQNYGAILADLERGEIMDLLVDRTAETLVEWLRERPGIEVVTRDRSQTYADAIQQGAPDAIDQTIQPPTLCSLTWSIVRRPDDRTTDDELISTQISDGDVKLSATIELAREFAATVRDQQAEELDGWLQQAHQCGIRIWSNFASGLDQDYDAVHSALLLNWSNGPTEGHVNRLKCLKRQMVRRVTCNSIAPTGSLD